MSWIRQNWNLFLYYLFIFIGKFHSFLSILLAFIYRGPLFLMSCLHLPLSPVSPFNTSFVLISLHPSSPFLSPILHLFLFLSPFCKCVCFILYPPQSWCSSTSSSCGRRPACGCVNVSLTLLTGSPPSGGCASPKRSSWTSPSWHPAHNDLFAVAAEDVSLFRDCLLQVIRFSFSAQTIPQ